MTLGFDKPLYILPFDQRGSFQTKLFGWKGTLSPAQTAEIAAAKQVICDGFKAALAAGVKSRSGRTLLQRKFSTGFCRGRSRKRRSTTSTAISGSGR